jgi:hypothetical protein
VIRVDSPDGYPGFDCSTVRRIRRLVLGHAVAGADDGVGTVYLAGLPLWNSQMGSGLHLPVSFPAVGCPDACLAPFSAVGEVLFFPWWGDVEVVEDGSLGGGEAVESDAVVGVGESESLERGEGVSAGG